MKHLLPLFSILFTLLLTACGDDSIPDPPERGFVCVTALDQDDQPMEGCDFDYEVSETALDEEIDYSERYGDPGTFGTPEDACGENQLLIYGPPDDYNVRAKCGKLEGQLNVDLNEGANEDFEIRLVGSFCTDGATFETDLHHDLVELQDHLGFSTATRCANWLTHAQQLKTEVVRLTLNCEGLEDCNPLDGQDYLEVQGDWSWYSQDKAMWLVLKAATHLVPEGETRTVNVTLRQTDDPEQELDLPIVIRGEE